MENEVWKQSTSLPEYYVSSWGRIMRAPFKVSMPRGGIRYYGGKPRYGVLVSRNKSKHYKLFQLNFRNRTYRVSRLICEAFHGPAPFNSAEAMHLDENSTNNRADNLQWALESKMQMHPGL
jgi:hypothetical protein